MLFDHDAARDDSVAIKKEATKSYKPADLIKILAKVHSGIASAAYVSSVSTSACIYDKAGKLLRGEGSGTHIYLFPKHAIDIPRYLETLGKRLILAGYGRIEISRSGALNVRTLIDLTVGSPERLDFVGGAICRDGLIQKRPKPVLVNENLLDTLSLPDLTDNEEEQYWKIIEKLKQEAKPLSNKIKGVYIEQETQKLIKIRKITPQKAKQIIIDRQNHVLQDDDILYFAKNKGKGISVRQALEEYKEYDKQSLADPLEPEYDGNNLTKAIFYYNQGKGDPRIHSYAHGSCKYAFQSMRSISEDITEPIKPKKKKPEKTESERYPQETLVRLNELNKEFAGCLLGDKFRIIHHRIDTILKQTSHVFLQKNAFHDFYANEHRSVNTENGQKLYPISKLWMEWPDRKTYKEVVFYPGKESLSDSAYNLFQGFSIKPQKGSWVRLKEHIFNIICAGDNEHMTYLLDWMARCVQDPAGDRPGVAIVMRGGKGCGKGIFANYFGRIFGEAYMPISTSRGFVGRFNWHLAKCLCVFLDEAIWSGDKQHEGQLKALITEPEMMYEPKGVEPIKLKNYMNVIMASNEDWVCPATIDERRFFVLEPLSEKKGDTEYFNAICDERDNGGVEALYYDLLHRKYDMNRLRNIPLTEGLMRQVEQSLDLVTGFWVFVLERGFLLSDRMSGNPKPALEGDDTNLWPEYAYKYEVYDEFQNVFCRKERFVPSNVHFWRKTWGLIASTRDVKKNLRRAFRAYNIFSVYAELRERTGITITSLENSNDHGFFEKFDKENAENNEDINDEVPF